MHRYTLRAIGIVLGLVVAAAAGAQLNEQRSSEAGVTVSVTRPPPLGGAEIRCRKAPSAVAGNAHVPPRRGEAALVPLAAQVAV